jgi:Ca2+-transporting ATPase
MDTVADQRQLKLYGLAVFLMIFGAEFGLGQRILGTVSLTGQQWLTCIVLAFVLLLVDEVVKFFMRRARNGREKAEVTKPAPQPI